MVIKCSICHNTTVVNDPFHSQYLGWITTEDGKQICDLCREDYSERQRVGLEPIGTDPSEILKQKENQ